jgi:PAS domain-containing protein
LTYEQARQAFLDEAASLQQRTRDREARLEDHERVVAELQEHVRHLPLERERLQQSLETIHQQLRDLDQRRHEELETHERARQAAEAECRRLFAEHAEVRDALNRVRADAQQTLERLTHAHTAERARLEALANERDAQLREQAENHRTVQQAAQAALAQVEDDLRRTREASSSEIARIQHELGARVQELDLARSQCESLRTEADRVPPLQRQLEDSQEEDLRRFSQTPVAMCRCSRTGEVERVNPALMTLLGYPTADDPRSIDFADTVFGSSNELRWLIDRCLSTAATASIETTWKRQDGHRLVVRLVGLAASSESVEIVAEDMTARRALEQKLRRAQRMEAVGRLASEVATTCDQLLREVGRDGEQLLSRIGGDRALRRQAKEMLAEVSRAAGYLQQLADYGRKETSALEPAEVTRVLGDVQPALTRVAGDAVEIVFPTAAPPVYVDADAERVERILVNVANYARQRMPAGGRLKIDLETVTLDGTFIAEHPGVRPGAHALITVTEEKGPTDADRSIDLSPDPTDATASEPAPAKPAVDLGILLRLVGDCGGHLWLTADPPGNMVLKIHLPRHLPDEPTERQSPAARPDLGRTVARWFSS